MLGRIESVTAHLADAGVTPLLVGGLPPGRAQEAHLLVPRRSWADAEKALRQAAWRHQLGGVGLWRLAGTRTYGWDDGTIVHLHKGVPAAPLPALALRRLERRLWTESRPSPGGWRKPEAAPDMLFTAVQVSRPGFSFDHEDWMARLAAYAAGTPDGVEELARRLGLAGTLNRSLAELDRRPTPPARLLDWRRRSWSAAGWAQRHVRPRRLATPLKSLLSASPLLDRASARCHFGGLELVAGPKVFKPRTITETFVATTVPRLRHPSICWPPVVVEIGTGCGAVALAVAAAVPDVHVHAVDVFRPAIRSARRNRRRLGTRRVQFYRGSLFDPLPARVKRGVDVVVANVPYVPPDRANWTWRDAPGSIGGKGPDGLGLVRDVAAGAKAYLRPGGALVLQMTIQQWAAFSDELAASGYRPGTVLAGRAADVVVWAELEGAPVAPTPAPVELAR